MFNFKYDCYTYLFILLMATLSVSPSFALDETRDNAITPEIRVALGLNLMDISINLPKGCKIIDKVKNKEILNSNKTVSINLRFNSNGKFSISALNDLYSDVTVYPSESGRFKLNKKSYRGDLRIITKPDGIWLINHVDIEEYLYGVVPYEIPMSWSIEAVKAQAVAARTYAVRCLGQYPHGDFDVYDSVRDQVYGGIDGEAEKAINAVEATRGIILTYQGWPIKAYYHSDSGGRTEEGKYVFPGDYPYLKSVESKDNLEKHRWQLIMKKSELESLLKKGRYDIGDLIDAQVVDSSPTGRPVKIKVTGTKRKVEISSNDFRKMIGAGRIRSTLFAINDGNGDQSPTDTNGNFRLLRSDSRGTSFRVISSSGITDGIGEIASVISSSGIASINKKDFSVITLITGDSIKPKENKKPSKDEIMFYGCGFGHGVGMSQWGAKAYADEGMDYRWILLHYYPGAELSVWY